MKKLLETKQKNTITINGVKYTGSTVYCDNNHNIYVDNLKVDNTDKIINISVEGDCTSVSNIAGSININGDAVSVDTLSGDIFVKNVSGDVSTMSGDVIADTIGGSVDTMSGNIRR